MIVIGGKIGRRKIKEFEIRLKEIRIKGRELKE